MLIPLEIRNLRLIKLILLVFICLKFISYDMVNATMGTNKTSGVIINHAGDVNLYSSNGYSFFMIENKLYTLLWSHKDGQILSADSYIASTVLGDNNWNVISISGKAFYLGQERDNNICSIEQHDKKWEISFYNLEGQKIRSIEHKYQKQKRENYHFIPIPIVLPDSSIILFAPYSYNLRGSITTFLLNMLSGGHGEKTKIGDSIELVPSLIGENGEGSPFAYIKIVDSTLRTTVFKYIHERDNNSFHFKVSKIKANGHQIMEYEMIDRGINVYQKKDTLITVSDSISIYSKMSNKRTITTLPAFPKHAYGNGQVKHIGQSQQSDIVIDSKGNIYYAFHEKWMEGVGSVFYVYFYNKSQNEWKTNKLNIGATAYTNFITRIFSYKDDLYIGFWSYGVFKVVKCSLSKLKQGKTIDVIWDKL